MELEQFQKFVSKYCRIVKDRPLIVGFSGGPDSLCLLDSLTRLDYPVIAAHFDHQLRPGSADEAEAARQTAERMNVPFLTQSRDVAAYAHTERLSIEEAARILRYRFLFEQARRVSAQAVAVGHHADDQVETLLLHLLRGTGLHGLTGMAYRTILPEWDDNIPVVRPLLAFWREEITACCQERGLLPTYDPSNLETAYLRNRLRHELIPSLEQYNPQARRALWRTAQILSADAEVLRSAVEQALTDCQARFEDQAVGLRLDSFQQLSRGLQRAVLRQVSATLLPGDLLPAADSLDFEAVERGLRWANHPGSGQVDLTGGLRLFVERGWVWITRAGDPPADWPQMTAQQIELPLPGVVEVAPGWRVSSLWEQPEQAPEHDRSQASAWEAYLDAAALPAPLVVRKPRPGDRFQPLGMEQGSQKLSDFWVNNKLPRRARAAWPLVACDQLVVWVPGYRPAHPYRLQPATRRVLHLSMTRLPPNEEY